MKPNYTIDGSIGTGSGYRNALCASTPLTADTWHFVVSTYDGSTLRTYVDGTSCSSVSWSGNNTATDTDLTIGVRPPSEYFKGSIDDVAIWKRVLLPDEIKEIYESEKGLGEIFYSEGNTK